MTDGAADMPGGWEKTHEINVIPINIHFGEKTYLQFRDLTNIGGRQPRAWHRENCCLYQLIRIQK